MDYWNVSFINQNIFFFFFFFGGGGGGKDTPEILG